MPPRLRREEQRANARRRAEIADWRRRFPNLRLRLSADPGLAARLRHPSGAPELREQARALLRALGRPPALAQLEALQAALDALAESRGL